jgi:hypothetical protein
MIVELPSQEQPYMLRMSSFTKIALQIYWIFSATVPFKNIYAVSHKIPFCLPSFYSDEIKLSAYINMDGLYVETLAFWMGLQFKTDPFQDGFLYLSSPSPTSDSINFKNVNHQAPATA